jgi:glycine oxidase
MARDTILIVGGGIIGCGLALRLADEGMKVTVVERGEPGREASWAAAGMLAPSSEHHEEPAMEELARASAALYPEWLERLGADAASKVEYRTEGTLQVAFSEEEEGELEALPGERISPAEARCREPALSEQVIAAIHLPDDRQLDNRRLMELLVQACVRAGVGFHTGMKVGEVVVESGRATGVRAADGMRLEGDAVVNTAGCWAAQLGPESARLAPSAPVRGQIMVLQAEKGFLRHVVRAPASYLVPRHDGRVLVGGTMEKVGFDRSVTSGGLHGLATKAHGLVPDTARLAFDGAWAGLRPGSPDDLPILGATDIEGYFVATGHFRNGILLAPMSVQLMAEVILGRAASLPVGPFSPLRFAKS